MEKAQKALEMLMSMNQIDQENYSKILRDKIGMKLLSIFEKYCRELVPDDNDEAILNTLVHLMITGYLIRSNEEETVVETKSNIQIAE